MTSSRDIFTKISDTHEKEQIFFDLAATRSEIIAKVHTPLSETNILKANYYANHELECTVLTDITQLPKTGEMILQITLGDEKYLCSSVFHIRESKVYISTQVDIFHLQRRADFRLRLPINYKAFLDLKTVNGDTKYMRFQLVDLSGGGCRFMINPTPPTLKIGDEISADLHLPDRPSIAIRGIIRHERDDEKLKSQTAGVEFLGLSEPAKNKLIALVMDLYREIFSRWTQK